MKKKTILTTTRSTSTIGTGLGQTSPSPDRWQKEMARNVHDRYHNNYEDYHDHELGESHDEAKDKNC